MARTDADARRLEGAGRDRRGARRRAASSTAKLTDGENGLLNPLGVNCLRTFPVVRQRRLGRAHAATAPTSSAREWKYVPVRRLALFLEESLYRGTQWVVFEPNDEPLWAQIRLNVGAFMHDLFRQGAFQGTTPREAYFVKCDSETTTQTDINLGIVNILVGFAPLKPAEFVVIQIQQIAGQIAEPEEAARWPSSPSTRRRFDPYKNFKFRVKWDGRYVAGVSKVGALKRTTEVVKHREGGDPSTSRKSPGRTKYEAITLERGVTHDVEFEQLGQQGLELRRRARRRGLAQGLPQGHHHRGLQRGRAARDRLQGLPLLGLGVPGAARPRRQRQRGRDPAHQARERGLGARLRRRRAHRAELRRAVERAAPCERLSARAGSGRRVAIARRRCGGRRAPTRRCSLDGGGTSGPSASPDCWRCVRDVAGERCRLAELRAADGRRPRGAAAAPAPRAFGDRLACMLDCPRVRRARWTWTCRSPTLLGRAVRGPRADDGTSVRRRWQFRLPTGADLEAAARAATSRRGAAALLERCVDVRRLAAGVAAAAGGRCRRCRRDGRARSAGRASRLDVALPGLRRAARGAARRGGAPAGRARRRARAAARARCTRSRGATTGARREILGLELPRRRRRTSSCSPMRPDAGAMTGIARCAPRRAPERRGRRRSGGRGSPVGDRRCSGSGRGAMQPRGGRDRRAMLRPARRRRGTVAGRRRERATTGAAGELPAPERPAGVPASRGRRRPATRRRSPPSVARAPRNPADCRAHVRERAPPTARAATTVDAGRGSAGTPAGAGVPGSAAPRPTPTRPADPRPRRSVAASGAVPSRGWRRRPRGGDRRRAPGRRSGRRSAGAPIEVRIGRVEVASAAPAAARVAGAARSAPPRPRAAARASASSPPRAATSTGSRAEPAMSNHLAIATVTATLRRALSTDAVDADVLGARAPSIGHAGRRRRAASPIRGVNIFLYQVDPERGVAQRRPADARRPSGERCQPPARRARPALPAHVLRRRRRSSSRSACSASAVRALHARPVLTRAQINDIGRRRSRVLAGVGPRRPTSSS